MHAFCRIECLGGYFTFPKQSRGATQRGLLTFGDAKTKPREGFDTPFRRYRLRLNVIGVDDIEVAGITFYPVASFTIVAPPQAAEGHMLDTLVCVDL